jgi:hypothetical protein
MTDTSVVRYWTALSRHRSRRRPVCHEKRTVWDRRAAPHLGTRRTQHDAEAAQLEMADLNDWFGNFNGESQSAFRLG